MFTLLKLELEKLPRAKSFYLPFAVAFVAFTTDINFWRDAFKPYIPSQSLDTSVTFTPIAVGFHYALAASFRSQDTRQVVFLSAHADAFNAARRRTYTKSELTTYHEPLSY